MILTDLQKRFAVIYEILITRADVLPLIPDLTNDHDLCVIPSGDKFTLNGFYFKPRFEGNIELKVNDVFFDLFNETGLKVNAEEIGLIVSWNVFHKLIAHSRKENDEAHDHVFNYLLGLLDSVIEKHPNERLIGLAYQTLDYQSNITSAPQVIGLIH